MNQTVIIAAARTIDQQGCLSQCEQLESRLRQLAIPLKKLIIEPLSSDWHSPLADGHFRSGCAPIEALAQADELIQAGAPAVMICGDDPLKSGYDGHQRRSLMAVYGENYPLTQAYNDLAERFIERQQIGNDTFLQLAQGLFNNYHHTYEHALKQGRGHHPLPSDKWYRPITPLFRGVDCANPLVDFSGRLLLVHPSLATQLGIPTEQQVCVEGVGLGQLAGDGRDYIEHIAAYEHLTQAHTEACHQADIDYNQAFLAGDALLDAYTCYPVVPMAFLLASGLVTDLQQLPEFLQRYPITVTGGMNLARAAWNNPALNGLITMVEQLQQGEAPIGAVHGNGGLGYRQGVAILSGHSHQRTQQAA